MNHDPSPLEIVLEQIKDFRTEINDKLDKQADRLSELEANTKGLFDNGQPGRLTKIEQRLTSLERAKYYAAGYVTLLGTLLYITHDSWLPLFRK